MKRNLITILLAATVMTLSGCNFDYSRPVIGSSQLQPSSATSIEGPTNSTDSTAFSSNTSSLSSSSSTSIATTTVTPPSITSNEPTTVNPPSITSNEPTTVTPSSITSNEPTTTIPSSTSSPSVEPTSPVVDRIYTIEFATSPSDSSSQLNSNTFKNAVASGMNYIVSVKCLNCYKGKNGIKLGKSTAEGYFDITLSSEIASSNVLSVKYYVSKYGNDLLSTTLSLDNVEVKASESEGEILYTLPVSRSISSLKIESGERTYISKIEINCAPSVPVDPTAISISSTKEINVGKTETLEVTYTPSNCNRNKEINWTSSNPAVATVINGGVKGISKGTAVITATSVFNASFKSSCNVTVTETPKDKWTIMIYMCGSDLESQNGLAVSDLNEMKSVVGQPDDVNIVIEAGGATSWTNTMNGCIDSSKLNRFHLSNGKFVSDEKLAYSGMCYSKTLQDFITWTSNKYPAEKYGLILWNHGGGQFGVCYDEKIGYGDNAGTDALESDEVIAAVKNSNIGKMEFIGYDACLMELMELAELNSDYFNYQVGSQESENGYGWDYDTWLDDLYKGADTPTILKAICDGFINDNGGVDAIGGYDEEGYYWPADQTMSYLDLSKISVFKTAWESMSATLSNKITTSNKSKFNSEIIGKTKYFAGSDYSYFCLFDCYHFLTILENHQTFNPGSSYIQSVKDALNNLVCYNITQKEAASDAHGLSFFYVADNTYGQSYYNNSKYSRFPNWVALVNKACGNVRSTYQY